ncbi:MAG: hypothetical protein QW103_01260 [Candidatus Pacearchaeota archaeon]
MELNSRPGSEGLRILREIEPSKEEFVKRGIIPFEYDNKRRKIWGEDLRKFLTKPLL